MACFSHSFKHTHTFIPGPLVTHMLGFIAKVCNYLQNISNYCTKETDRLSAAVATTPEYYIIYTESSNHHTALGPPAHSVVPSLFLCSLVLHYPGQKKTHEGLVELLPRKTANTCAPTLVCATLELLLNKPAYNPFFNKTKLVFNSLSKPEP